MRTFETIVIILIFITLIGFTISKKKKPFWFRFLPGVAIVCTGIHLLFEGYRWQMVPAYVFTVFLFIITLRTLFTVAKTQNYSLSGKRKTIKIIGIVFGFILFLIVIIPPILFPVFTLPTPSGRYAVGTKYFNWMDTSRSDLHTTNLDDFRSISLQMWYPSEYSEKSKPVPYISKEAAVCWARSWKLNPEFALTHFSLVQTHSYYNTRPVILKGKPFPVILFSPSGNISYNTSLFEELASHGYVILCVGHPHWCPYHFNENGQINCTGTNDPYYERLWEEETSDIVNKTKEGLTTAKNLGEKESFQQKLNVKMPLAVEDILLWAEDYDFAIQEIEKMNSDDNPFKGMLDLERIGVMGLSKGGASAGQFCVTDPRCRAGVNLGGFMFGAIADKTINRPFLFMEHIEPWCEDCLPVNDHIYSKVANSAYMVQIKGARHFNFTDLSLAGPFLEMIGLIGPISGDEFIRIQNAYVLAFFDKHLKGVEEPLLNGSSKDYSEVVFKSRHP